MIKIPTENVIKEQKHYFYKNAKVTTSFVILTLMSSLLISAPIILFPTSVFAAEPSNEMVLTELGFSNISLIEVETFPPGIYRAILLAELGGYCEINVLSYYPIETNAYQTIFTGPEGAAYPSDGFVDPPVIKTFEVDFQFGLTLQSAYRFFTEYELNPDYPEQHVKIYENLDAPNMFLICFEDQLGGVDRDYNDVIFSLEQIFPPEIISITRTPESPTFNQPVTISADITPGNSEIESVFLSYQINSSNWINTTMTMDNNLYLAEIPSNPSNTKINYKIFISDTAGNAIVSEIYSYTVTITDQSPIAVFTFSPSIVDTNEDIYFDATGSHDPDGTITTYSWDFGDGNDASEATTSHSYIDDGEYTITLTIVDDEGLIGSKTVTLLVKNRPPTAALGETPLTINKDQKILFVGSQSFDTDGVIITYTWSFGDGTAASGVAVTHTYSDVGFYDVTLAVSDNDGATDEHTYSLEVIEAVNIAPVASFMASAETINLNKAIDFDASESYDPDGSVVNYYWDFGDGNTATGIEANHTYEEEGIYTVTLIVTDDYSAAGETTKQVTITKTAQNTSPVAAFTKSPETVNSKEPLYFDASESYDTDGSIMSYIWDFGDGTTDTGVTIEHTYNEPGKYTVTLTVIDNEEASTSQTTEITIETETNTFPIDVLLIALAIVALIIILLLILLVRRRKNSIAS